MFCIDFEYYIRLYLKKNMISRVFQLIGINLSFGRLICIFPHLAAMGIHPENGIFSCPQDDADKIIMLEDGLIAEEGSHQYLSGLKGKYYELVKNQLELGS